MNSENLGSYTCQIMENNRKFENLTISFIDDLNSIWMNIAGISVKIGSISTQDNMKYIDCFVGKKFTFY
jgi:hypothetical protein